MSDAPDHLVSACATIALVTVLSTLTSERSPFRRAPLIPAADIGGVERLRGSVRSHGNGSLVWESLRLDDVVHRGDSIFTGDESSVSVLLADHSRIELGPSSYVVLESTSPERPVAVRVRRGAVEVSAGRHGMNVSSGTSSIAVAADSDAGLSKQDSGGVHIEVHRGHAEISSAGVDENIAAGHASELDVDGSVTQRESLSIRLTSPLRGKSFYARGNPDPVELRWESPAPIGTVLEIARESFDHPLVQVLAEGLHFTFQPPAAGVFSWRLTLAGVPLTESSNFAVVDDRPAIPAWPNRDELVIADDRSPILLCWGEIPGVDRYQVQVSTDPEFATATVTSEVSDVSRVLVPLAESERRYFWRVRAADPDRHDSPFSERAAFRLTRITGDEAPVHMQSEVHVDAQP